MTQAIKPESQLIGFADADREMIRSLRQQMAERERNRQQIGLLHRGSRVRMPPAERAVRWMRVSASYAVPVLGALGALVVFIYQGSGPELIAAAIPTVFTLLFLTGAQDLSNRYARLVA